MDIFGIGPLELVLIIVLALIFLGPEDLPKVMRSAAKLMNEIKQATDEISSEIKKEIEEVEKTLPPEVIEAKGTLQDTANTVNGIRHLPQSMLKQLDPKQPPTPIVAPQPFGKHPPSEQVEEATEIAVSISDADINKEEKA